MDRVWSGTVVTQDSIYQAVASLLRVLGDDPKTPTYIATVPRRGYRLVAKAVAQGEDTPTELAAPNKSNRRTRFALSAGALVVVLLGAAWWIFTSTASAVQSVAVLPFLDLTSQAMNEEYFADGMTEELIDRLSRLPGLRVPPPTASFYFKGKRMSVGEIAKALNVSYVLDGSVRRAGATMRVAVRLVRADDGFIVWSQTYDRESPDLLQVQDDIAAEVARTLEKS
jgi:TolB-like protein